MKSKFNRLETFKDLCFCCLLGQPSFLLWIIFRSKLTIPFIVIEIMQKLYPWCMNWPSTRFMFKNRYRWAVGNTINRWDIYFNIYLKLLTLFVPFYEKYRYFWYRLQTASFKEKETLEEWKKTDSFWDVRAHYSTLLHNHKRFCNRMLCEK